MHDLTQILKTQHALGGINMTPEPPKIKEKGMHAQGHHERTAESKSLEAQAGSPDKEALILSTVHAMRLFTVATDPRESFAVGTESTNI